MAIGWWDMSFDISKLTNAVNRYLNSISEVSNIARKTQEEIESRTRFSTELSTAIQKDIQNRINEIDSAFDQINGAFEEIRSAGAASTVHHEAENTTASSLAVSATRNVSEASESANLKSDGNGDAYSGVLSTKALQDLSKSRYFSSDLIQSSLFKDDSEKDNSASSGSSALEGVSLSDLNKNSLLASSLTGSGEAALTDSSDLAKALIKAYTNSSTTSTTSIFGDFTV